MTYQIKLAAGVLTIQSPSTISENELVEDRIGQALQQARDLGETATNRRTRREDRLRSLGFEDPTNDERREWLARNAALKDWPGRY